MQKIVDQVMLLSANSTSPLLRRELREKVSGYVELLRSAGKRDPEELVTLGGEYLRQIVDGPDPRFTGW
jgi:hypothetical protein